MKKLILIISVIILYSCSQNGWYRNGHIDKDNPCTFIVNDSIKIIGEMTVINDYCYKLFINGKQIMVKPSVTWRSTNNSIKSVVDRIEERYCVKGTKDEYGYKPEKSECFKY